MLSSSQSLASRAPLAAQPRRASAAGARQPAGRRAVQPQALFGLFSPTKPKAGPSKAQELVDNLLELTRRTDGGLNASPAKREQIAELVEELQAFCPRNPLRSPLLFGDYEVLYASKPQSTGGPFRSPLGRAVFFSQRATQNISEPNVCINELSYKTLGLIPGSARQEGEIKALSGDTFQLTFPALDSKVKSGPPQRIIQIAYLDDRIRVARAIPPEDRKDQEGALFVFRRVVEEEEAEAEEEAPKRPAFGTRGIKSRGGEEAASDDEASPARRGSLIGTMGTQLLGGRKEGLATMAEKRYAQQQGGTGSTMRRGTRGVGTQGRGAATQGTQGTGSPVVKKSREEVAAERAAAKAAAEEEKRAAREAAAQAKAAAEEERRVKAAQQAELKEGARAQMAQLQGEASEAVDEAKQAAAVANEASKAASDLLKQAGQARGLIDQAASAFSAAAERLEGLKAQEKEAAAEVADARTVLKQLEGSGRRK